jgi:CRP-like cAMP-binding protein
MPAVHRNRLLASLTPDDLDLIQPHLTPVSLRLRQDLEKPNRRIDDVYFMEMGITSVVAMQSDDTQIEVGLIGCEGMTGLPIVLGDHRSPHSSYIQVAGAGQRLSVADLRKAMKASPGLRDFLLRYVQSFMVQATGTAVPNGRARLEQRLARWLLMAHDRVKDTTLPLTHEFLSLMLAVRRAGVTETVQKLVSRRLIEAHRGTIVVLDRKGLEQVAGVFYGQPEAEYRRLIG